MTTLSLVMPMAGRGSRFKRVGRQSPKPLVNVAGRPAFAWAVESVRQAVEVGEMVFVVLDEHVRDHAIDRAIKGLYPTATIVTLEAVTNGAAETAALGVQALRASGPLAVNDCDHAFRATMLPALLRDLHAGATRGALVGFESRNPAYSYAQLDGYGRVSRTAEKAVIGPYALAGCYMFDGRATFERRLGGYRAACPYPELYMSGLFDAMARDGEPVAFRLLDRHVSFGTPEELDLITPDALDFLDPRTLA
jgi:dTDP-glucose pyrophosphorylase